MSKSLDFSVVIPVCHGGSFLKEALLSLKAIDYPPERFEVLIAARQEDEESMRIAETETVKSFRQSRFLTCPHANRSKLLNEACMVLLANNARPTVTHLRLCPSRKYSCRSIKERHGSEDAAGHTLTKKDPH